MLAYVLYVVNKDLEKIVYVFVFFFIFYLGTLQVLYKLIVHIRIYLEIQSMQPGVKVLKATGMPRGILIIVTRLSVMKLHTNTG